jgi:hypothetical protein
MSGYQKEKEAAADAKQEDVLARRLISREPGVSGRIKC